ncbi:type II toxin-antitoxin system RelE/ParE family toxin [Sulfuritalea sp.]|uniref:type II toxin-antitoxin system RelE/ParE family toxin n=1 Tax=Sulfuritalea sp. TaxID=2480090 RepID=UPI00286DA60D|nr:type II toxin-antitoxin system RelE/ParE family toxin [Sulfuritalea sp.]
MKIRLLSVALDDLDAGRRFYEKQQAGLGDYFLDSLFSDIDSLLLYAGIHQKVFGYHRTLSRRFPYAIYYRVEGEDIQVWRVLDCRQNPALITERLKRG